MNNGSITKPEDEFDKIYTIVLQNSNNHDYSKEEKECIYEMLRDILGSIVCLFSLFSANFLATWINFSGEDLRQTLKSLHSIFDIPVEPDCPVRLYHHLFRDLFLYIKQCTAKQFQVHKNTIHWFLANSCIYIMSNKPKKDICNLHQRSLPMTDIDKN